MIIHIDGLTGSGKTVLGKKISRELNHDVIDVDDIHTINAHNLLSKYNFDINQIDIVKCQTYIEFNNELLKNYMDELLKINQADFNKELENYKDNNIIITGNLENIVINADKGYYIKIDKDLHYKQYNIKIIEEIYKNYDEIKKILNSDISLYNKRIIIAIKYNVPPSLIPNYEKWIKFTECSASNAYKSGYKYASQNEIFSEVTELLKI